MADAAPVRIAVTRRTRELDGNIAAPDLAAIVAEGVPTILKGAARGWPLVQAGLESPERAVDYLLRFQSGQPVVGYTADPATGGRFHYNEDATNVSRSMPLSRASSTIAAIPTRPLSISARPISTPSSPAFARRTN
jgi:hypothetical protein